MNELAMSIKAPKLRGEWVELRFMAAAAENDLHVTKPWGDSAQYDFIVEYQSRFLRIQVKSTKYKCDGCYPCAVQGSQGPYLENAFEFLAVYVIPEDLWYIIPAHVFRGQASVCLSPTREDSKYGKYLGAWELLKLTLLKPDQLKPDEVKPDEAKPDRPKPDRLKNDPESASVVSHEVATVIADHEQLTTDN
jgi:hypothetical protein